MKTTTYYVTIAEVINGAKCPLLVDVIPNHMGINLCSVAGVEWERRDDGQLTRLTILFLPADKAVRGQEAATTYPESDNTTKQGVTRCD